ncbi:MAG: hypothetical protein EOQ41_03060 [Mesorhizobium sp.]|uniref:MotA/TolQ/ExbB proton channel family protein n=1 Tax=Mesorhizobium sp. TaxID=1871066 RepID=UPI000FE94A41|nr:MotA/TolQ/ExbB proton channel family protein [Mesorhizobium sp.]RWB35805.1 MAG: hypothetical protein EOQ41_03060 [Mesorhizobium sp.]
MTVDPVLAKIWSWFQPAALPGSLGRRIAHFAPNRGRLFGILMSALLAAVLAYSYALVFSYGLVKQKVDHANVVDSTLRTFPNYPIGPMEAKGKAQLDGDKLETAGAFEVLRSWGVLGRNVQLAQILKEDTSVAEEVALIKTLVRCTSEPTTAVALLRCSIPSFGGSNQNAQDKECLWRAVSRALAGYPGSSETLAAETATRVGSGQANSVCPAAPDDSDPKSFAFDWFSGTRDDVSILRDVLLASGAIAFPDGEKEVENTGKNAPSWWHFSKLQLRFLEEVISRLESDAEVKKARSWLVLLRGPEQFLLILTTFVLLALLGDRIWQRRVVKREAQRVLEALHDALNPIQKERNLDQRSAAARKLANRLEKPGKDNLTEFVPPPQGRKDMGVRADSVVVYMAEKAVRRIVIEPREPELFRQTCDSINAGVERSGWLLRYASRALPAIGFIGTVRGIMLALPAAQNLFGTTGPAQIAALNGVIEPLGLAFATTLIALVGGLVTALIGDWEIAQEQLLLSRIEESLIDYIDPAEV